MTGWTVRQFLDATCGQLLAPSAQSAADTLVEGLSCDSRQLQPGDAFLAIPGPRFNAHAFLPEVTAQGASCLIVQERPTSPCSIPVILVPDTVKALG